MNPLLTLSVFAMVTLISFQASAQEVTDRAGLICDLDPRCMRPGVRGLPFERGITPQGPIQSDVPGAVNLYVNFAYDSADLTTDSLITLDRLGEALTDDKLANAAFLLNGHTDGKGSVEYNVELSRRRAEAVRRYLLSKFRIAPERLIAKGYGKMHLLDPTRPDDGVNRRVQVINASAEAASTQ